MKFRILATSRLRVYSDTPGFCKAETIAGIAKHGFVLTPGRYVGAEAQEDDSETVHREVPATARRVGGVLWGE